MKKTERPLQFLLIVYSVCFIFRIIEYLVIRTDQSVFGEAFIHKLLGIFVMIIAARFLSIRMRDIGFKNVYIVKYVIYGLLLGLSVFVIAYGVELLLAVANGGNPTLQLYVSSYAVDSNEGRQTALIFFIICVIGNIINVVMEEGVFRGLSLKLLNSKFTFLKAALISSLLFGAWHIIGPFRSFIDGDMRAASALVFGTVLFISSALVGLKFCLLTKLTGSLWMAMADHFVNNTVVNILHVVTRTGADEQLMIRIAIAQTVSFLTVLMFYIKKHLGEKRNQFDIPSA